MSAGIVFNIQRYSVHDGPGIRSLVFLKGCPLRCRWCSNPESQAYKPELAYNAAKCLGCGACVAACDNKALSLGPQGVTIHRDRCAMDAMPCVRECPAGALTVYGTLRETADVIDEVEQDCVFYARTGGGMTLSGGEALAQPEFALALLREARHRRIHTAVETCALVQQDVLLEAALLCDYVLMDVKTTDSEQHKAFTGVPVDSILANIRALRAAFPALPIHLRTPVIPGFNATEQAIAAIGAFVREIKPMQWELLQYHAMGEQKYRFLNRAYPLAGVHNDSEQFERLKTLAVQLYS